MSNILLEQHMRDSRKILSESVSGLDIEQRKIVEGVYNELRPLIEASLTPDQINQLFGEVEKAATASGSNRTLLGKGKDAVGKGVDVAKQANELINKAGRWLQNTKPVQAFDQKFENLKNKINTKFPDSKVLDMISNMGIYAKNNPGKTAFIVGVLTAIAALAGGPIGGAIAGQVLRGSVELLKGEKLSTAIGKGVKTAVLGFLTGAIADKLGSWLSGLRAEVVPFDDGLTQVSFNAAKEIKSPGFEWTRTINLQNITVLPDDRETVIRLVKDINDGDLSAFDSLYNLSKEIRSLDYKQMMSGISQAAKQAALDNDAAFQALEIARKGITAAAQGAVAGAGVAKKESYFAQTKPLSEGQVYLVFNKIQQINEGPMDWIKTKAANLTNKVTADKLNSAWQSAGSPTESDALKAFLEKQGVDPEIINTVYSQMKIASSSAGNGSPPGAAGTASTYAQVKQDILKLDKKSKQRIAAYIQKRLGTI
jgi:hypothetical protein